MKIRNGFVSNSSSSSFILYGFMCHENSEEYNKLYNLDSLDDYWDYITYIEDEGYLIGETLSSVGDEEWKKLKLNFGELENIKKSILDKFKEEGIDFSKEDFQLILGNHYS